MDGAVGADPGLRWGNRDGPPELGVADEDMIAEQWTYSLRAIRGQSEEI